MASYKTYFNSLSNMGRQALRCHAKAKRHINNVKHSHSNKSIQKLDYWWPRQTQASASGVSDDIQVNTVVPEPDNMMVIPPPPPAAPIVAANTSVKSSF